MPDRRRRGLSYGIARAIHSVVTAYHDLYPAEGGSGTVAYDTRSTVAGQFELAPGAPVPGAFGFTSARKKSTASASNWPPE